MNARFLTTVLFVLLCSTIVTGALSGAQPGSLRLTLSDAPGEIVLGEERFSIDDLVERVAAAGPVDVILLAQGDGGALPARSLLPVLDRLLRSNLPVRAELPRTRARLKVKETALDIYQWTAEAPRAADVCVDGRPPPAFSAEGLVPLLEVDLRGAAALTGASRPPVLKTYPPALIGQPAPGEKGPSATLALAVGEGARMSDLFLLFKVVAGKGFGRILFLLDGAGEGMDSAAGLLLSLEAAADRPTPLPHRKTPPSKKNAPAYRAIRLLAEEALLAMRLELRQDGSMPEDSKFTDAEATALALMAFLGAGVRAGDSTPSGSAVMAMERWLLAWPPNPNRRYPRRERTIVSTAMIEAFWRTRHPLLVGRAQEGLGELLKEVSTDQEFRDGIEKGFEAIGIVKAREAGIEGAAEAEGHLLGLIGEAVDPEGGPIRVQYSTRSSVDYIALANALTLLEKPSATDPRILYMVAQTGNELPSINSRLPNEKRAFGTFFHARFALNADGDFYYQFVEMLKASLPKAAPGGTIDIEEMDPDEVMSPWSGGGSINSVARVALMAMAYEMPDQRELDR